MNGCINDLINEISTDNMMKTLKVFSKLHRYSGSEHGETSARYILDKLHEYGVEAELERYELYRSLPTGGTLSLCAAPASYFEIMPAVFSLPVENRRFELVYVDVEAINAGLSLSNYSGKAILVDHNTKELVERAEAANVGAIISLWKHNHIHHSTIGTNWGTPGIRDAARYAKIPFAEMSHQDGEELKRILKGNGGQIMIELTCAVNRSVVTSSMPVARISGRSNAFILITGHYDSWYEGITDNAAANAIMVEMARVLSLHQSELDRGVVFGWWSGHSDARYAGSTWFCDNHWQELYENCVAHLNIDIAGCKGSDMIVARSTLMEGREFCGDLIREFTHKEPVTHFPMYHAADQSFWGADIPINIMYCYEQSNGFVNNMCAMPSFDWWHTPADGFDKADPAIVLRDCSINLKTAAMLAMNGPLKIDYDAFFMETEAWLLKVKTILPNDIDVRQVRECYENVKRLLHALEDAHSAALRSDSFTKRVAGGLNRITYTYADRYEHDDAVPSMVFPLLYEAACKLRDASTPQDVLFAKTDIVRQRNRLVGELNDIKRYLEGFIMNSDC